MQHSWRILWPAGMGCKCLLKPARSLPRGCFGEPENEIRPPAIQLPAEDSPQAQKALDWAPCGETPTAFLWANLGRGGFENALSAGRGRGIRTPGPLLPKAGALPGQGAMDDALTRACGQASVSGIRHRVGSSAVHRETTHPGTAPCSGMERGDATLRRSLSRARITPQ